MAPKPKFLNDALQVVDQARSSMALMDALNLLKSTRSSAVDVAKALQFDPKLTEHILIEVNSPFFGLRNKVENVEHAIALLGFKRIQELLSKTKEHDMYKNTENSYFEMAAFRRHGVAVGCISEQIAIALKMDNTEEFFQAGMMHDIGKYLYLVRASDEFQKIVAESRKEGVPVFEMENRVLGTNHCELGNLVADAWGLSDSLRCAVRYHHGISDKDRDRLTSREGAIVEIVTYANLLSHGAGFGPSTEAEVGEEMPAAPGILTDDDIRQIMTLAETQFTEVVRSMGLEN